MQYCATVAATLCLDIMTILVTGSSGFVGLNLLEQLLAEGRSVTGFSLHP